MVCQFWSEITSENNSKIKLPPSAQIRFFSLVKQIYINVFNKKAIGSFRWKVGLSLLQPPYWPKLFFCSIHISTNLPSPPSYMVPDVMPHWCIIDCFIPVHQKVISRHPISWSTWHKVQWNPYSFHLIKYLIYPAPQAPLWALHLAVATLNSSSIFYHTLHQFPLLSSHKSCCSAVLDTWAGVKALPHIHTPPHPIPSWPVLTDPKLAFPLPSSHTRSGGMNVAFAGRVMLV